MIDQSNMSECSWDWGCKCQDAKNNTYTCLRSLSESQDSLFCEFSDDSSSQEFYDLLNDPYQLHNLNSRGRGQINPDSQTHQLLLRTLSRCKGWQDCSSLNNGITPTNPADLIFLSFIIFLVLLDLFL